MNDDYSGQTAIYGGMQAPAATLLEAFIAAMPSNSWAEYTGTNINEMLPRDFDGQLMGVLESEANKPLTNWANKFTYNQQAKVLSGVGTAEGYISADSGKNYTKEIIFDMAANVFSVRWNPLGRPVGHCYDANLSLPINGKLYRRPFAPNQPISERDASGGGWQDTAMSLSGIAPSAGQFFSIEGLPDAGEVGSLLLLEDTTGRLVRFDLATNARTVIGNYSGIGSYPMMTLINGAVLFGAGNGGSSLYTVGSSLNVQQVPTTTPVTIAANSTGKLLASPSGENAAYSFTNSDGLIRKLDITTGAWSDVGAYPSRLAAAVAVVAISLQGLGAFAFWYGRGRASGVTQSEFWIYKV